jgi:hypothetical protein
MTERVDMIADAQAPFWRHVRDAIEDRQPFATGL